MKAQKERMFFYEPGKTNAVDIFNPKTGLGLYSKETLEQIQVRYPEAQLLPESVAMPQIEKAQEDKYCFAPKEITDEQFYEALESLPPLHHICTGIESFCMSEFYSSDITAMYFRVGDKYFQATDHIDKYNDLRKTVGANNGKNL